MNTSMLDHRPMPSTRRYSRVRNRSAQRHRCRTATTNQVRLTSFSTGTSTLAKRTMIASGQ
jgi:hypothetical protein